MLAVGDPECNRVEACFNLIEFMRGRNIANLRVGHIVATILHSLGAIQGSWPDCRMRRNASQLVLPTIRTQLITIDHRVRAMSLYP